MNFSKWFIIGLLLVASTTIVSGCLKRQPVFNINQVINSNQNTNTPTTTTEIDTSDWKTYRNEQYGFGFRYPKKWTIEVKKSNMEGYFLSNGNSRLALLPYGEFDHGFPWEDPVRSNVTIGGKLFTKEVWILDNNEVLEVYYAVNTPLKWLQCDASNKNCNRIELVANSDKDYRILLKVIQTIVF